MSHAPDIPPFLSLTSVTTSVASAHLRRGTALLACAALEVAGELLAVGRVLHLEVAGAAFEGLGHTQGGALDLTPRDERRLTTRAWDDGRRHGHEACGQKEGRQGEGGKMSDPVGCVNACMSHGLMKRRTVRGR